MSKQAANDFGKKKLRTFEPLKFDSVPPPKIPFYSTWPRTGGEIYTSYISLKTCFSKTNFQVTLKPCNLASYESKYFYHSDDIENCEIYIVVGLAEKIIQRHGQDFWQPKKVFMKYLSNGQIEFQGQNTLSSFDRSPFSYLSQITVQIFFDQGIMNIYNDGILQLSFGPIEEIKSLDGMLKLFVSETTRTHSSLTWPMFEISPFFPQIVPRSPELLKRDPKKIGMSLFLQSSPYFYRKLLTKPSKDGTIPSAQSAQILWLNEKYLVLDEETWNRIVSTIVQLNLSVEFHCSDYGDITQNNQISNETIATRICSIGRYIWRAFFTCYFDNNSEHYIFKTFKMNPNTWKNVFCYFVRVISSSGIRRILAQRLSEHGAFLSFKYRGVSYFRSRFDFREIAHLGRRRIYHSETTSTTSITSYLMIDLLIYQTLDKIRHWLKDLIWEKVRLFFIAIKKETFASCPFSILPREILLYILDFADLRNVTKYSVDLDSLDLLFRKYLPQKFYSEISSEKESIKKKDLSFNFEETNTNQQRKRGKRGKPGVGEEDSIDLYQVSKISFYSMHYISKSIAQFSPHAVAYLCELIGVLVKEIFQLCDKLLEEEKLVKLQGKRITPYHILLVCTANQNLIHLGINPAVCDEWKWIEELKCQSSIPQFILSSKPCDLTEEQQKILLAENHLRKLFVEQRNSPELNDLYIGLIPVYSNQNGVFVFTSLDEKEKCQPMLFKPNFEIFPPGKNSVVSHVEFEKKLEEMTSGAFQGLNWKNVFLAGGAVLGALSLSKEGFEGSDLDLFIYGLDQEDADKKIYEIIRIVEKNLISSSSDLTCNKPLIVHNANSITLVRGYPHRNIQIVLRLYKSPAEVLLGFDVDSCCVGFDGKQVWATPRSQRAINKRYNLINTTRRSTTYEYRLWKYSKRGFGVCIPSLDGSKLDVKKILSNPNASGLAKLILYQSQSLGIMFDTLQRVINKQEFNQTPEDDEKQSFNLLETKRSDYSNFMIPFGKNWTLDKIVKWLNARNWKLAYSKQIGSYLKVYSSFENFFSRNNRNDIVWMVENPGQQNLEFIKTKEDPLLRGSFYPLPSTGWQKDAYF